MYINATYVESGPRSVWKNSRRRGPLRSLSEGEPLFQTPAAVYVITAEDIRRSGATSIPDALRLAPGVDVARINSNQGAIGIRGFTSRLSPSRRDGAGSSPGA